MRIEVLDLPSMGTHFRSLTVRHAIRQVADPSTSDTQWAHRERELRNRHMYLKDFWYAAGTHPLAPSGLHR